MNTPHQSFMLVVFNMNTDLQMQTLIMPTSLADVRMGTLAYIPHYWSFFAK